YAARRLERRLPRHGGRLLLVSDVNFMLYTPLLPGAAAGSLEPRHVVVPLREELEWTEIRLGEVVGADPQQRELRLRTVDGRREDLRYDQLIVALGSVSRVLPVPGLAEHALGFKDLADAIALRNRVLWNLEVAESLSDPQAREEYLTCIFVGAGYAGLEGIAELQDYVADVLDRYPRCRLQGARWILVEAQERVMPETPASLAAFAEQELRRRGIEIRTRTRLDSLDERSATLSTGERIPTRTLCWTTGVRPPGVVAALGLPVGADGRIRCDQTLRVEGLEDVWAIGDAAGAPDPAKRGRAPSPPTAQHAIRQGRVAADNVAAVLAGRRPRRFRYRTLGVFVDMGQHKAVATVLGLKLSGFPAWFTARTYHMLMMPGLARRLRLIADWTVGLLFGRASAELGQLGHPAPLSRFLEERPPAPAGSTGNPPSKGRGGME
ncbi:MAG: FAD-dependent oxidoreductase, partial [Actinomycetota bacterium]|nr:FAD-dependent oxidoreductase [Actinomycetota bacterium]